MLVDDSNISYKNGKNAVMLVQNKIDKIDNDKLLSRAYKISVKSHSGIQELMHDLTMT